MQPAWRGHTCLTRAALQPYTAGRTDCRRNQCSLQHFVATRSRPAAGAGDNGRPTLAGPAACPDRPAAEGVEWFGLFVPAATPAEFVSRLNASVCKALDVDAVKTSLAKQSFEPRACTPAELAQLVKAALESWRAKVKASGFKSMD